MSFIRGFELLIFDNRVEIVSPGCLPDGLSVDDIKFGNSAQRNPLIATFCTRTMIYRGIGTGIIRSIREGANIEFVNDNNGNQFKAILWRTPSNENTPQVIGIDTPSRENTPQVIDKDTPSRDSRIAEILKFCQTPKSIKEIAEHLGLSDRKAVRNKYVRSLIGTHLQMSDPKSPTSPQQKYMTIQKNDDKA